MEKRGDGFQGRDGGMRNRKAHIDRRSFLRVRSRGSSGGDGAGCVVGFGTWGGTGRVKCIW